MFFRSILFALLFCVFASFSVEIIEEKNIVLTPEPPKVEGLKEGYIILEYPNYQLVINLKTSKIEETHLPCSLDAPVFLYTCGEKLIKPKIIDKLREYNKIARNIHIREYARFDKDTFGICTEGGIFLYKNGNLEPIITVGFPSYIEDCGFSPDGKYAVYSYGKNFFKTLINLLTFGKSYQSSYSLKEVNIQTKKEKTLLKGYKFFPFYNPKYSLDSKKIYFLADMVGDFKDKGLYSYDRVKGALNFEVFMPFGNPFIMPDGNILVCYFRNIYIYDVKKKEISHIFTLDRDCPGRLYYTKERIK